MKNKDALGKVAVFSFFIFGSLLLVFSIWTNRLVDHDTGTPSYVRATLSLPTAEGFEMTLEELPTRDHEQGSGGGGGSGEHDEEIGITPTPTFNVDDWVPEEGISDDLADE